MRAISSIRPRYRLFLAAAFAMGTAALLLSLITVPSIGQEVDSSPSTADANVAESVKAGDKEAVAAEVKLDETKPSEGVFGMLNGVFEDTVNAMAGVLFYRVGAHDEVFVQLDHTEKYVRPRGSAADEPFVKYEPYGLYPDEELDLQQAKNLLAISKLQVSSEVRDKDGLPNFIRKGTIGGREVEFLSVIIDTSSKLVRREDGEFVKQLSRQRESDKAEDSWTRGKVDLWGQRGWLKSAKTPEIKDEPAYIRAGRSGGAPVVVIWLALGSLIFTVYMRGFNIWGFKHAVQIVRGKYDNPDEPGEVTHFQALSSALSATVGLGNIAGVTIAMTQGGPGAFFWMVVCGFLGMTSKFVECTLGQKYRQVRPDGTILGGPMQYLHAGLKELGMGKVGFVLAIVFAVMCILASFGGGNMFQANQSGQQMLSMLQMPTDNRLEEVNREIKKVGSEVAETGDPAAQQKLNSLLAEKESLDTKKSSFAKWFLPVYGVVLALMVGIVILGGIKRIASAAEKIVPSMCLVYLAACILIILANFTSVPEMIGKIISEAWSPKAFGGGLLGVLIIGVQRAAFSNEAGVGSASIAHSAAKTEEPVREGCVALLGPFIDTIVVCSMTALVILITGAWDNKLWVGELGLEGTPLTSKAFGSIEWLSWFPYLLSIAVVLFAYSTMISWSYYGERCWVRLFGPRSSMVYRLIFVIAVFVGAVVHLGAVLDFSDMMILSMAFPNVFGLLLLSPKVRRDLLDYWRRYKAGEFKEYK